MGKFEKHVDRQDYFLATGEVVFTVGENETPNAIRCNTVVMSNDGRLSSLHLARTQQMVQAQFFRRMGGINDVKVVDVVIIGLIHLGKFTHEEFNKAPEGMAVAEQKPSVEVATTEQLGESDSSISLPT